MITLAMIAAIMLGQTRSPYVLQTIGPMNLQVDPVNGLDGNNCNVGSPCKTVQKVCNLLNGRHIRDRVDVALVAGTYAGMCRLQNLSFDPFDPTKGAMVRIHGHVKNAVLATGTATGTSSGGNANGGTPTTFSTLNDVTQAWTPGNLIDFFVRITAGTGAGQVREIIDNTATQIRARQAWGTVPDATSVYVVQDNDSIVNSTIGFPQAPSSQVPLYTVPITTVLQAGMFIENISGEATVTDVTAGDGLVIIESIKWQTAAALPIRIQGSQRVQVMLNQLLSTGTSGQIRAIGVHELSIIGNVVTNSASNPLLNLTGTISLTDTSKSVVIRGNHVTGGFLASIDGSTWLTNDNQVDSGNNSTGIVFATSVGEGSALQNEVYNANSSGPAVQIQGNFSSVMSGTQSGSMVFTNDKFDQTQNGVVIANTQFACTNLLTAPTIGITGFGWLLKRGSQLERPDLCAPVVGSLGVFTFDGVTALPDLPGVGNGTLDYYCRADTMSCMLSHSTAKHF